METLKQTEKILLYAALLKQPVLDERFLLNSIMVEVFLSLESSTSTINLHVTLKDSFFRSYIE